MKKLRNGLIVLCFLLGVSIQELQAKTRVISHKNAAIEFSSFHQGDGDVLGIFTQFNGTLNWPEAQPFASAVSITIDTLSINTQNKIRDKHLRSGLFLGAKKHPHITFESQSITKSETGWNVNGTLKIKGTSQEVIVPVTQTETGGYVATLTINRHDYKVSAYKRLIQPDVSITVKLIND